MSSSEGCVDPNEKMEEVIRLETENLELVGKIRAMHDLSPIPDDREHALHITTTGFMTMNPDELATWHQGVIAWLEDHPEATLDLLIDLE